MGYFMTASDISNELEVSRSSAYKIIKELNSELQKKGYRIISGKVPREYVTERYYMMPKE